MRIPRTPRPENTFGKLIHMRSAPTKKALAQNHTHTTTHPTFSPALLIKYHPPINTAVGHLSLRGPFRSKRKQQQYFTVFSLSLSWKARPIIWPA